LEKVFRTQFNSAIRGYSNPGANGNGQQNIFTASQLERNTGGRSTELNDFRMKIKWRPFATSGQYWPKITSNKKTNKTGF
jgi:hypothetical protein